MTKKQYISRKMFFQVLWPSLVSALALSIANTADAVAVGNRLGEAGLAAISIITPVYMIYNLIGYAFSTGGCVTHSKLAANGKEEEALSHFKLMFLWLMGISAGFAIVGNLFMRNLLYLLGLSPGQTELLLLCEEYGRPLIAAAPLFFLNFLFYDFVRCDDDAPLATMGFSVGCVVDVVLNIVFVLVLDFGVRGSIWATLIAQGVSVGILSRHFFNKRGVLQLSRLISAKAAGKGIAGRSLYIGFSTSARYVFQFLFLLLGNRLLLRAGELGFINGRLYVAVFDVVMNVSYLIYGLYQAFSDTMQPLASTFAAEHDKDNLHFLLTLALRYGLMIGLIEAGLISLFASGVSRVFGLEEAASLAVSVRAIRIFCISTPFAGVSIIMTGFFQSSGQERFASLATVSRTVIFLLPVTLMAGIFFPIDFWWLFLISEAGTIIVLLIISVFSMRKRENDVPVFSYTMDQENHELQNVLDGVERFCEEQDVPMKKAMQIQLAVEELCAITIEKAFVGGPDEYIQVNLAKENNEDYVLHIRNSAPYFNPLDLRMGRLRSEAQDDLLDSVGVMLVRKSAKDLHYRNYVGFNVMTVVL